MSFSARLIYKVFFLSLLLIFSVIPSLAFDNNVTFDQNLGMLNVVVAGMGILIALITLIFALIAFFGYSGYQAIEKFKDVSKSELNNALQQLKEMKKDCENEVNQVKEDANKINEELNSALQQMEAMEKKCKDSIIKLEEDYDKVRDYIKEQMKEWSDTKLENFNTIDFNKNPPDEILKKFRDYEKKLETIEALGMQLGPDSLLIRGVNFFYSEKYQEALSVFDNILKTDPYNSEVLANKGATLAMLDKNKEALIECKLALDINPKCTRAWNTICYIIGSAGDHKRAIDACN